MTIRIRLNDDPNTWGTDGDQTLATRAAEIMRDRLESLLAEEYPEATIDIDIQPTETPDAIQVFKAEGDYAETIEGNILDTLAALHADVLADALAEQREPMEIQGRCYIPQVAIYQAQVATGAARREGRAPSHDGECVWVFWTTADTLLRWIVEDNAGVSYTSENYADVDVDDDELADVVEGIDIPGNQPLTGSGSEALDLMVLAGWLKPCDEPADE